jgi:uncharacterized membrane protein
VTSNITSVAAIEIRSTDPLFLAVVLGVHLQLGLVCVVVGAFAMLSKKGRGRHSTLGAIYFWCLLALAMSATLLSAMRWGENYHLFALGISSFASAWLGRSAVRQRLPSRARLHITGMGAFLRIAATLNESLPREIVPRWLAKSMNAKHLI